MDSARTCPDSRDQMSIFLLNLYRPTLDTS